MSQEISGRDFGRLEEKVDGGINLLKDIDRRVRAIEATHNHTAGRHSVISLLGGSLAGGVVTWLARTFSA